MRRIILGLWTTVLVCVLGCNFVSAQATAQISGTVTDSSGACHWWSDQERQNILFHGLSGNGDPADSDSEHCIRTNPRDVQG